MAKSPFSTAMDSMQRSVGKAFDNVRSSNGVSNDPDLSIYNALQPADFEALAQKFGPDTVVDYVKAMEAKRISQKGG